MDVRGQPDEVKEIDASGKEVVRVREMEVVAERETGPAHRPIAPNKRKPAHEFLVPGVPHRAKGTEPAMDFLTKKRDKAELLAERNAILRGMEGALSSFEPPRLLEIDEALIARHGFEWSRPGDGRHRPVPEGMGISLDEAAAVFQAAAAAPVIRPDYAPRSTNYNRLPARAPRGLTESVSVSSAASAVVLPPISTIFGSATGTSTSSSSSTAPQRQTSSSHAVPATPAVPARSSMTTTATPRMAGATAGASSTLKTPSLLASAGVPPTTVRVVHGYQSPVAMQPISPGEALGTVHTTASTASATSTVSAAPSGAPARSTPPPHVPPRK